VLCEDGFHAHEVLCVVEIIDINIVVQESQVVLVTPGHCTAVLLECGRDVEFASAEESSIYISSWKGMSEATCESWQGNLQKSGIVKNTVFQVFIFC
jgi:hypothetical protein